MREKFERNVKIFALLKDLVNKLSPENVVYRKHRKCKVQLESTCVGIVMIENGRSDTVLFGISILCSVNSLRVDANSCFLALHVPSTCLPIACTTRNVSILFP